MTVRLILGDCRDVLRTLPESSVDSVVTDPPYELTSARPGGRSEATRGKVMGGFMGMKWDGTGVAFDVETWAQCLRVLKPGGHLLAFGGTRTYHRMVCAIEDAGFEIRDQLGWVYGSGFPKSRNLDGDWQGWGTALKPAWEPIVMARRPLVGTVAANVLQHGTGALNIDGCRVGETVETWPASRSYQRLDTGASSKGTQATGNAPAGRWPANLIHDGSDEVVTHFPQTTSGEGAVKRSSSADGHGNAGAAFGAESRAAGTPMVSYGDTGSAARFFYCAKADASDRNDGLPERGNHHPTVKPTDLMRWLCRLVTPPGGTVLDPFMGSGSTLKAAELEGFSAIGIEREAEYIAIARRRIAADAPLFAEFAA